MTSSDAAGDSGDCDDADDVVLLPGDVRETLRERTASGAPEEICGVLVGERGVRDFDDPDSVHDAVPVPNVADSPETRYELDPAETIHVIEGAEAAGNDAVGFYHSHPRGPVEPSVTDSERATWEGYAYCIVSPTGLAAYRWTGAEFRRLRVETP